MIPHDETNGGRRLRYVPQFDAGNILTVISMVGSLIVVCSLFYARAAVMETRISVLEGMNLKMGQTVETLNNNQTKLIVLMDEFQRERKRP